MTREPTRAADGRFAPRFGADLLIEIVHRVCEVAAAALGTTPARLSQRAYDEHRVAVGLPDAPRADKIVRQLGISWRPLLASIFERGTRSTRQALVAAERVPADPPTEEAVADALKLVAGRLRTKRLYPWQYEQEQQHIEREARLAWLHGRPTGLPTIGQIVHAYEWDAALKLADLEAPPKQVSVAGVPHVEAAELFLRDLGYLPRSIPELRRYTQLKGIAVAEKDANGSRSIKPAIEELRARWQALGRWMPPRYPGAKEPPPWHVIPADDPKAVLRKRRWTLDECIDSLVLALNELERRHPGARLTQKRLREISRGPPRSSARASLTT